jgi:hypothetical protein
MPAFPPLTLCASHPCQERSNDNSNPSDEVIHSFDSKYGLDKALP